MLLAPTPQGQRDGSPSRLSPHHSPQDPSPAQAAGLSLFRDRRNRDKCQYPRLGKLGSNPFLILSSP